MQIGVDELKFFNKLERKYGKYAINNLMYYIIVLYVMGWIIQMFAPGLYYSMLALDVEKIVENFQIWRLFTFIIMPPNSSMIFMVFALYLYYMLGNSLERVWGAFKFNAYFFMGVIFHIIAAFLIYFICDYNIGLYFSTYYINLSLFLAFACIYPNMELYLFFVIPIKIKWLGIFDAVYFIYTVATYITIGMNTSGAYSTGAYATAISAILSMLNFIVFFFMTRNYKKISPKEIKRKQTYRREVNANRSANLVHKCDICGRTNVTNPELTFRYCSKCTGNHEYCNDHLFTHEHVK